MTMTHHEISGFVIDTFEGHLYTDDPVDAGGATKFGITRRTLAYARGRPVSKLDVKNLNRTEAVGIGVRVFMQEPGIDRIPDWRVRLVVYDYTFHSGHLRAIKALQSAVELPRADQDGIIGPQTLGALSGKADWLVMLRVLTEREEFMQDIMDRKQTQRKYMLGWWRRTTKIQRVILL